MFVRLRDIQNSSIPVINNALNEVFDIAVIITNDSYRLEPMRNVREKLALPVGIINPQQGQSHQLQNKASFIKSVRL